MWGITGGLTWAEAFAAGCGANQSSHRDLSMLSFANAKALPLNTASISFRFRIQFPISFLKMMVSVGVSVVVAAAASATIVVVAAKHQVLLQPFIQKPHITLFPFYLWQRIFHHGDSFISFIKNVGQETWHCKVWMSDRDFEWKRIQTKHSERTQTSFLFISLTLIKQNHHAFTLLLWLLLYCCLWQFAASCCVWRRLNTYSSA